MWENPHNTLSEGVCLYAEWFDELVCGGVQIFDLVNDTYATAFQIYDLGNATAFNGIKWIGIREKREFLQWFISYYQLWLLINVQFKPLNGLYIFKHSLLSLAAIIMWLTALAAVITAEKITVTTWKNENNNN